MIGYIDYIDANITTSSTALQAEQLMGQAVEPAPIKLYNAGDFVIWIVDYCRAVGRQNENTARFMIERMRLERIAGAGT